MSDRRKGLQLSPAWRRRTRLSPPRGNLPNAFTPRSRENMIRMGFIRPIPAPTSAERSAAATKIQRLFRAKKEKVNTKLAFRKSLPYVKAVLQKTKGSGGLTSNELYMQLLLQDSIHQKTHHSFLVNILIKTTRITDR
jgi:hypothetical protein